MESESPEKISIKRLPDIIGTESDLFLAGGSEAAIVPLGIAGTRAIFPSQSRLIRGHGPVALVAGDPIPTEGYTLETKEALMDAVRDAIGTLRERARALVAKRS